MRLASVAHESKAHNGSVSTSSTVRGNLSSASEHIPLFSATTNTAY